MKIINLTDFDDPSWCWLREEFLTSKDSWLHLTSQSIKIPNILPKKDSLKRAVSAYKAVKESLTEKSVLVSHGPRPAYYGASAAKILNPDLTHLVYSFNFTDLPTGLQHKAMMKAYKQVERFVVYSSLEKKLYADYFEIPIESIDMLHWSVHNPNVDKLETAIESGQYICAIGSQGRDYETLIKAMRKLKNIKLVLVASPQSVQSLEIPENVKLYTNISLQSAHNILAHSQFMVVPLRDSKVPCGHVTLVSGMYLNKAMIVTDSEGIHDYIKSDKTGVCCEPKNPDDLAKKIQRLWEDVAVRETISQAGNTFAHTFCTPKTVINYFDAYLKNSR
jgi:glycosyltransferase involved in cell wall biosynthesis